MTILICILTAILIGLCVVAWSRVVELRSRVVDMGGDVPTNPAVRKWVEGAGDE